jgi:hypothetical protein
VFTPEELSTVCFHGNQLYRHKVIRINYTTYDIRRSQDSLNPRAQADFMCLSHEDGDFPYWFGRIVGIFHADVVHLGPASKSPMSQHMEFLWVRWFGRDLSWRSGFKAKRLHRIGFVPGDDSDTEAFGFLDPKEVIRAIHLVPTFAHGRTDQLLMPSTIRPLTSNNEDWCLFYVNM